MFFRSRRLFAAPPSSEDISAALKVLGLPATSLLSSSSPSPSLGEDVRKRYRELARLHHPDLSSGDDNRMKVINTAYELIQSSGILQGGMAVGTSGAAAAAAAASSSSQQGTREQRFKRTAGSRRKRVPDDFASGDDQVWSMKSSLEWQAMMNSADTLTQEELKNPANHPFSHSKFFTFDEDMCIYRMIRGGATVPQVARTLGKPATFIEKRLQNAQFKLRIQYVLRNEKRGQDKGNRKAPKPGSAAAARGEGESATAGVKPAYPVRGASLLRKPFQDEDAHHRASAGSSSSSKPYYQKKEWVPTMPEWRAPQYVTNMSLEEKGRFTGVLPDEDALDYDGAAGRRGQRVDSKLGRSYSNYARLKGSGTRRK